MPKGKILVMDDDELIRELLEEILRQFGYDVEFAKDGGEAIDLYRFRAVVPKPYTVEELIETLSNVINEF